MNQNNQKSKKKNEQILLNLLNTYHNENNNLIDDDQLVKEKKTLISKIKDILPSAMNSVHGMKKSDFYWNMILISWIEWFVAIYIHRKQFVEYIKNKKNYELFFNSIKKITVKVPFDWNEFMLTTNNLYWNFELISQLLLVDEYIDFKKNDFVYEKKHQNNEFFKINLKFHLKKYIFKLIPLKKNSILLLYPSRLSRLESFKLFFKSFGKIYTEFEPVSEELLNNEYYKVVVDIEKRNKLLKFLLSSDILCKDLCLIISLNIPITYIENFNLYYQSVKNSLYLKKVPRVICTSSSHHDNIFSQILLAELKMLNKKIITIQHGGANFGIIKTDFQNGSAAEYIYNDVFLTWGWKINHQDLPFPSLRLYNSHKILSKYKSSGVLRKLRILFVCGANKKYELRRSFHYKINHLKKNFNIRYHFFNNLPLNIKEKISLRPYHYQAYDGMEDDNFIKKYYKDIKIHRNENIYKLVSENNLVIFDSLATFNFEIMTINKPFLLLFDVKTYNLSTIGTKLFEKLKLVEIYHSDYKTIISTIMDIDKRGINIWWQDDCRTTVVNDYREEFGLFNINTSNLFTNFLKKL